MITYIHALIQDPKKDLYNATQGDYVRVGAVFVAGPLRRDKLLLVKCGMCVVWRWVGGKRVCVSGGRNGVRNGVWVIVFCLFFMGFLSFF